MKKIILFFLFFLSYSLFASEVIKETHLYSIKGADSLRLDRYYTISDSSSQELKPAIIFVFGGAFLRGERDKEYFMPCFEYYAKNGYEIFSIDYRLGLKNISPTDLKMKGLKSMSKLIKLIDSTINLAVVDLYDATSYILSKSEEWGINPELIVPFGSSAGGMAVLQAEYYGANGYPISNRLPAGFRYAGIISMAGAIFCAHGELEWKNTPAPILMFQGSADRNVPYNKERVFKYGFYGSKSIAKSLKKINRSYYFYTFEGAGHEIAVLPMNDNREDIDAFLVNLVQQKLPLEITKRSVNILTPKVKDRFTLKDYLRANFTPKDPSKYQLQ